MRPCHCHRRPRWQGTWRVQPTISCLILSPSPPKPIALMRDEALTVSTTLCAMRPILNPHHANQSNNPWPAVSPGACSEAAESRIPSVQARTRIKRARKKPWTRMLGSRPTRAVRAPMSRTPRPAISPPLVVRTLSPTSRVRLGLGWVAPDGLPRLARARACSVRSKPARAGRQHSPISTGLH